MGVVNCRPEVRVYKRSALSRLPIGRCSALPVPMSCRATTFCGLHKIWSTITPGDFTGGGVEVQKRHSKPRRCLDRRPEDTPTSLERNLQSTVRRSGLCAIATKTLQTNSKNTPKRMFSVLFARPPRVRARIWPSLWKYGRMWTKFGRCWPRLAQIRTNVANKCQKVADFGARRATMTQNNAPGGWPRSLHERPRR